MPIDFYALCEDCRQSGPPVWRAPVDDSLRWFLVEHGGHRVVVVDEHDDRVFEWPRWENRPEPE